jgi:hypothetical protein|tara:strand:- start:477 stop:938 length:462 start_codon:yes stop_codon:yes gene_type:complete
MATYAPNGTIGNTDTTYTFSSGRSPNRYHLTRLLRKRGMQNYGEILSTLLTDSSPTTTMSVTRTQIDSIATPGGTNSMGGVRTTTSNESIDSVLDKTATSATPNTARAASAADVTSIQGELLPGDTRSQRKPSEANMVDLSGNGGGGKQDAGR